MDATAKKPRDIFVAAVKLGLGQWDAYLAEACGADGELRARVKQLLAAHLEAGSFLAAPAGAVDAAIAGAAWERPGMVIGPYKLLEQIGEGGFGIVFLAEQQEPVRRQVALKLIKPGMDTRQFVARFEAERQALAMMDHPNIAKVLDAGTTGMASVEPSGRLGFGDLRRAEASTLASGRPYFVMELIQGVPITSFCDEHLLTTRERLELFSSVCHAVQHAHQKGIIHRDLKPSNVLVTVYDGKPIAKVIDFGIAKAIGQQLTDKTLSTGLAQMIGTPLYMSPEQAAFGQDVDTRSDIYSLGVLLYELLTGSTPFDKDRLKEASYDEIRRIIREEEPPKPSTRVHTLGDTSATVSANRKSDLGKLSRLLRGDLDWIVMKCLEKDRQRRYETASGLARDLERYLHDDPVEACPPSMGYRFRKFARRNKIVLLTTAIVAAALLLGITISVWQAIRAMDAEDWAEKGWDAEKVERLRAVAAERKAKERLFEAKVAQADAAQWSGRPGQRFASLAALTEAVQLMPALDLGPRAALALRNHAIVSLTRADLRLYGDEQRPNLPANPFDGSGAWRVRSDGKDKVTLESRHDPRHKFVIEVGTGAKPSQSPCGRFMTIIIGGPAVQVWDLETKKLLFTIPEYGPFAFSPDSGHLVAAMKDGSLQVFDLRPGESKGAPVRALAFASPRATKIVVAPEGRRAAVVRKTQLAVIDLHTGATLAAHDFPGPAFTQMTWHPHGKQLAFVRATKIVIWEPGSPTGPQILDGHPRSVAALAFHPSGLVLASAGGDGATRLWDPWTAKPLVSLQVAAQALAFGVNGDVLTYRYSNNKIGHVQVATGRECRTLAGHSTAEGELATKLATLDISPNERWLASIGSDGLRLWDLEAGTEIAFVPGKAHLPVAAFDPANGNLVTGGLHYDARRFYTGYESNRYKLVGDDTNNLKLVPLEPGPPAETWRPRGPFLFQDPAEQRQFRGVISKDGRWLIKGLSGPAVAPGQAGKVTTLKPVGLPFRAAPPTLVDCSSGEATLLPFDGEFDRGTEFAISPDGRQLVTASVQKYYFWQPAPLKRTGVLPREPGTVDYPAVAFSPDSRMVAVARSPLQIALVDCETLEELATLPASNPEVLTSLCFSPKGRWLAAGTQSGRIQIWDVTAIRRQLTEIGLDWNTSSGRTE